MTFLSYCLLYFKSMSFMIESNTVLAYFLISSSPNTQRTSMMNYRMAKTYLLLPVN